MKPDFNKAQNSATELLLSQNVSGLYIDVRQFELPKSIIIDSAQNFCRITGFQAKNLENCNIDGACTLKRGNTNIVLYDDSMVNDQRKHWGIAHELGHIYLEHQTDQPICEIEAHFFAAQVTMTEIALIKICQLQGGRITANDIYCNFNASFEAAQRRIITLNNRDCWSSGCLDKQLEKMLSPYIVNAVIPKHTYA